MKYLLSIKKNGKYGLLNANGDTLLSPKYFSTDGYYNVDGFYFNEEEVIRVKIENETNRIVFQEPEIYNLKLFSKPDTNFSIYSDQGKFYFLSHEPKNKYDKWTFNGVGDAMKLKRSVYQIDRGSKTYILDKKGNTTIDPFENKTILHDLKASVIYKIESVKYNYEDFYGLADTNGVDLLDTVYQKNVLLRQQHLDTARKNQKLSFVSQLFQL